jgi:hypothetical protein
MTKRTDEEIVARGREFLVNNEIENYNQLVLDIESMLVTRKQQLEDYQKMGMTEFIEQAQNQLSQVESLLEKVKALV